MGKCFSLLLGALLFVVACDKKKSSPVVSTYAGTGTIGSVNGNSTEASFSNPMGLSADSAGNVYVADSRNNLIRKIALNGTVSTVAGSGKVGWADGKSNTASFFFPVAVAASADGSIYVADTHNSLIRKITPAGVVITISGRPDQVKADTSQRLDNPQGITVAKDGSVYFTDWAKDRVCKINPGGKVLTIAGTGDHGSQDGAGLSASFYVPEGIAVDNDNNLYIADTYNNLIRKINASGVVTTLAGKAGKKNKGSKDGKGAAASFLHPCGIAVDQKGNVYVADVGNNKIRKITPDGMVSTLAGTGLRGAANGDASMASFNRPYGVTVDNAGNVYVADYQNNLVRKISF